MMKDTTRVDRLIGIVMSQVQDVKREPIGTVYNRVPFDRGWCIMESLYGTDRRRLWRTRVRGYGKPGACESHRWNCGRFYLGAKRVGEVPQWLLRSIQDRFIVGPIVVP